MTDLHAVEPASDYRIVRLPNLDGQVMYWPQQRLVVADDRLTLEAVARRIQDEGGRLAPRLRG